MQFFFASSLAGASNLHLKLLGASFLSCCNSQLVELATVPVSHCPWLLQES